MAGDAPELKRALSQRQLQMIAMGGVIGAGLFVGSGRREAPAAMTSINARGVPAVAIVTSSVVGFLCVVMAAVSPDTVFTFLLNSSGAVILFVYLLICVSQIVLRYRRDGAELTVRMWLFPWLSGLTTLAILGVLVQMAFDAEVRIQLWLSLLSWAAFLVLFVVNRVRLVRVDRVPERVGG